MRLQRFLAAVFLTAASLILTAGRGEAQLIPGGGFEPPPGAPGMSPPWGVAGDTGTIAGPAFAGVPGWTATQLIQFAAMTNAAPGNDAPPVPPAFAGAAGLFGGAPIPVGALEAALGVPGGSLAAGFAGFPGFEGSGIFHPGFGVAAATTLSFDAKFVTNENFRPGPPGPLDFAFYSIDGGAPVVIFFGPQPFGLPPNGFFGFDNGPGFVTITTPVLGVGAHTIAFGVVDTFDPFFSSGLFVDNVRLNPVPEPSSVVATCGIAAGAVWLLRRQRKIG